MNRHAAIRNASGDRSQLDPDISVVEIVTVNWIGGEDRSHRGQSELAGRSTGDSELDATAACYFELDSLITGKSFRDIDEIE